MDLRPARGLPAGSGEKKENGLVCSSESLTANFF